MASRPNPTGLKDRSSRLQAFARRDSDSEAHYNAASAKEDVPPKRSETPHATSPRGDATPSRNDIAEAARVHVPLKILRNPAPTSSPRRSGSPGKGPAPQSPAKLPSPELGTYPSREGGVRRGIFEGSQLGEDFMGSETTTQLDEPEQENIFKGHAVVRQPEPPVEKRHNVAPRPHNDHENGPQFNVGGDGRMMVKSSTGWRAPSHMKDGFQEEVVRERRGSYQSDSIRSTSPAEQPRKLVVREPRLSKQRPYRNGGYATKQGQRSPSPNQRTKSQVRYKERPPPRESGPILDLDDESEVGHDDLFQDTPKAKKKTGQEARPALVESPTPPTLSLDGQARGIKRTRPAPDYDDRALSSMSYSELEQEPFDLDPAQAASQNGNGGEDDSAGTLERKLEKFRLRSEEEQKSLFMSMSMEEWEDSGDWFVDRFTNIMTRLRDARREKRQMVREFEAEASRREETVRRRSDAIDRKMVKMRQDGQRVVGDRVF